MQALPPIYSVLVDLGPFREGGEAMLRVLRDTHFSGLSVQLAQEIGDPAELICQYTQKHATDRTMMSTRGCGVFRHTLLGSGAPKVPHDLLVPVWTNAMMRLIYGKLEATSCALSGA